MGSNLADILQRGLANEPEEFKIIRSYIQENFGQTPSLQLMNGKIIISVSSSALAGSLRLQIEDLRKKLPAKTVLVISSG